MLTEAGGAPRWHPLGPGIPGGQSDGSGPGSLTTVAGRVTAIAVGPILTTLVGAATGGIGLSRDRGQNWTPVTDYQATVSIGPLGFDPSNPTTFGPARFCVRGPWSEPDGRGIR